MPGVATSGHFGVPGFVGVKAMLFGKKTGGIDWIVVGLGNPGMAYEGTRHNAGCTALSELAAMAGITINKKQFKALTGTGTVEG